jgi:hypothetical protein
MKKDCAATHRMEIAPTRSRYGSHVRRRRSPAYIAAIVGRLIEEYTDNIRLWRINRSKGHRNYSTFEEFKTKHG